MDLIETRRCLHRIPELGDQLPETAAFVLRRLQALPCAVTEPYEHALCAFFDFGKAETVAFRADMDALPIFEKNTHHFVSTHPGQMHACGHDGHMAMVLGLGDWVAKQKDLPRNVLLVFQPSEETTGGAKRIVDSGIFKKYNVTRIFGQHLWPELPLGTVGCRRGEMMSRASEVDIVVKGKSAHAAKSRLGIDAMTAVCEIQCRARALDRSVPPEVFRLIHFGQMAAGTVRNAVAAEGWLKGTLRAFQDEWFYYLMNGLETICRDVARETGCRINMTHTEGYPAVCNDAGLYEKVKGKVPFAELAEPSMIAEDFSYYAEAAPSVYFFLGCGPASGLHADTFDFDESVLTVGCDFLKQLAQLP